MKNWLKFLLFFAIIIITVPGISEENAAAFPLNRGFYAELNSKAFIQRDVYLDSLLNRVIISRGRIISVDSVGRYKKNYRAVIVDENSPALNMRATYYIFFSSGDTLEAMKQDERFEFRGQFMAWTHIDSLRREFIFDIVLEDGAIIVD